MASQPKVAKTDSSTKSQIIPSNSLATKSYCCLSKAKIEVDLKWTIERFVLFAESEILECFRLTELGSKYSLRLHLLSAWVQIDLHSSNKVENPHSVRVELSIIGGKSKNNLQHTKCIQANTPFPVCVWRIDRQAFKSENFVGQNIAISCKIESLIVNTTATQKYFDETVISDQVSSRILHQLEEMFEKMPLSDVTFNIRGRKFSAHKNILAMRSPVFAGMFHHPTREMQSNQVEIKDIDPDVFQEVLRFIYTGKTQSTAMDKMAPGILAAADKYLLEDLKSRCETHLIQQMSAENCLELLSFTTHHPAEHLTKYAIEYFRCYPGKPIEKIVITLILILFMNFLFVIVYLR